jgi:DNA invertase Pin-like site-specific DNA recombinase
MRIVEEYADKLSGAKDDRPGLDRLLRDAKARRFDAIVVWKLDRFGRPLRHLVNTLADLEALGVAFISIQDSLDFSTPSGRLTVQILGAMAEFERSLISERVRAGMRVARKRGTKMGRPKTLVDGEKVRRLRAAGASWTEISKKLRVPRTVCQRSA